MESEIIRLYGLGVQINNIATLTGISKGKVCSVIYKKHELCQRRKSFERAEVGQIREMYLVKRMTKEKIAEELLMPLNRVRSITRAYGMIKRKKQD
jgi:hypothetical protein